MQIKVKVRDYDPVLDARQKKACGKHWSKKGGPCSKCKAIIKQEEENEDRRQSTGDT